MQDKKSVYLGALILSWSRGDGPREGFYTENKSKGVPFIRINNLKNHSISLDSVKYIHRHIHETRLKRTQVTTGDLIFAISGTKDNLGTVSIIPQAIKEANLNSALVRLDLDLSRINKNYFTYLFDLNIIRNQVEYLGKGAAQNNLNNEEISQIIIPLPQIEKQKEIVFLMEKAYQDKADKEKEAETLFLSIDKHILSSLDVEIPKIKKHKQYTFKSSRLINQRFDAEYNQEYYNTIINAFENNKYPITPLGELLFYYKKGVEVGSEEYRDIGIPFIRVSDFTKLGISHSNNLKYISQELYDKLKSEYQAIAGEVIYSKDGTIGNSLFLEEDLYGIVSGGILRLKAKENVNPKFLSFLMASTIFKEIAHRESIGAVIKHLTIEKLLSIKIPVPTKKIQEDIVNKISVLIEKAKLLQKEATANLEGTKKEVEKILLGE